MKAVLQKVNWDRDYSRLVFGAISIIVLLKLLLMGLFSSDYQDKMFIPFVSAFVDSHVNPYEYYYSNQLLRSFPYPPLMLLIESIGGLLLSILQPASLFWQNLIFKLPLLAFDCAGLYILRKLSKIRAKYLLLIYFLSPINLYATYVHGQLDIIPTVFFLGTVYFLINGKGWRPLFGFSVFLALAISTKLHILAAVPVVYIYLYKKRGLKAVLISAGVTLGIVGAFLLPFGGNGLIELVFFSREQAVLKQVFWDYGTVRLIIPILAVVLIYLKIFELKYINSQLLISLLGVLFVVFLVCVPPMPGWFVWVITFLTLYFQAVNENRYKMLAIYLGFNILYVFYFVFCHQTEFVDVYWLGQSLHGWKLGDVDISNMTFTVMVGCLVILVAEMYRLGVASNSFYKRRNLPFTIGIAGDSGTGKSELLELIESLLGKKSIQYIEGDGDHRWRRGSPEWEQYTHLNPKANHLYRQARDITVLREGGMVRRVDYDHGTGGFTELRRITPKQYVILCGLHSLYLPQTREALDLKIYMDTDETLRRFWKIRRDTQKRSYTNQQIIEQIEKRMPDAAKYIYPQKEFADLSIRYFDSTLQDCCDIEHKLCLSLELTIDITINIEPLMNDLIMQGIGMQHTYSDDLKHQTIVIDGAKLQDKQISFQKLAEANIPQFDELFYQQIAWREGIDGLIQLFILVCICSKMRGEA